MPVLSQSPCPLVLAIMRPGLLVANKSASQTLVPYGGAFVDLKFRCFHVQLYIKSYPSRIEVFHQTMPRNWRGSRSFRGTHGHHFHASKPSAALPAPEKTQSQLTKLSLTSITVEDSAENAKIEDVNVVGTFNWKSSLNRVELVVPGKPKLYFISLYQPHTE